MPTDIDPHRRNNLLGSLWMIASMAGFAIEDVLLKSVGQSLPVGQILMTFGLGGVVIFAALALATRQPLFTRDVVSLPMRIRVVFEILGRLFYVLAIIYIPLSVATVILQATPLVVVAGAALVFGEHVGWRRWMAVFVGLAGVVIIVQPGADSFTLLSVFAIIGMLGFAGRDLASRAAPATLSTVLLGLYGFLSVIVAGGMIALWQAEPFVWPSLSISLTLIAASCVGVGSYASLMKAMRTGEVSAVTPFRYTRLIFGIACGMVFFGETLSVTIMIGSALILVSGLFILWRGKQVGTLDHIDEAL